MPILDPAKLGVVPCSCGRLSNKIHCPGCGSYVIRGLNKKNHRADPLTAETKEYQVYRCRVCMMVFDDWQWREECAAPQFETYSGRLQASYQKGDAKEISEGLKIVQLPKGLVNKGKAFSDADIEFGIANAKRLFDEAKKKKELLAQATELHATGEEVKNDDASNE